MANFMFRCPHCDAENSVPLAGVGQAASCAACHLPFMANVPAAALLKRDGEAWVPAQPDDAYAPGGRNHDDEQSLLSVHPAIFREHPLQTLGLTLLIVGGLTMAIHFGTAETHHAADTALAVLGLVLAFPSLCILAVRFVGSRFESLSVTTQRSVWARGIINRQTSEVQHDDIRNIQVSQTLIERFVGAGTLAISSAGQNDMEITIKGIANPRDVLETIRKSQSRMVRDD
ncbi:MAG: PH domain-containing protein [Phycisphaerales bacterium JB063]